MLARLLYVSHVAPLASSRLASTLEDILINLVRRNRADRITGFLLCDGEAFVQVLEGPQAALEACLGRISRDPRHQRLEVRLQEPLDQRQFPQWSMCGLYLSPLDDALLAPTEFDFNLHGASAGALLQRVRSVGQAYGRRLNAEHERLLRM